MSAKKNSIKDKIINIATRIFSKFGFKKTTVDDIAQALGKGKSSIYYYFKSKEEIFKAVIDKEAEDLKKEIEAKVINAEMHPKEKLRNYVLLRMKFMKNFVNFNEALRNDYLKNLSFVEEIREEYDKEEHQTIENILKEGEEKKVFSLKERELTAMAIVTAMKGLEVPLFIKNDYPMEQLKNRIDGLLDILFYGIVNQ
jgi:AcrR family transcriptional regulator